MARARKTKAQLARSRAAKRGWKTRLAKERAAAEKRARVRARRAELKEIGRALARIAAEKAQAAVDRSQYAARQRREVEESEARFIKENADALEYTELWHEIRDWALDLGIGRMVGEVNPDYPRVIERMAIVRWQWVVDLDNEREAERKASPLGDLPEIARPGDIGGRRRVAIRAMTWVRRIDRKTRTPFVTDPQWITLGTGMSAGEATANAANHVDGYASAMLAGLESRELVVTAVEIAWWTSDQETSYL